MHNYKVTFIGEKEANLFSVYVKGYCKFHAVAHTYIIFFRIYWASQKIIAFSCMIVAE